MLRRAIGHWTVNRFLKRAAQISPGLLQGKTIGLCTSTVHTSVLKSHPNSSNFYLLCYLCLLSTPFHYPSASNCLCIAALAHFKSLSWSFGKNNRSRSIAIGSELPQRLRYSTLLPLTSLLVAGTGLHGTEEGISEDFPVQHVAFG